MSENSTLGGRLAPDNGLLASEIAAGITRVKGVASKGVRLGNWLSIKQAQALLNTPDATTDTGLRDRAILGSASGLRASAIKGGRAHDGTRSATGWEMAHCGSGRQARSRTHHSDAHVGEAAAPASNCLHFAPRRPHRRLYEALRGESRR